jgi:hypothetical protein
MLGVALMIALPMVTAFMVHTVVVLVCGEERPVLKVVVEIAHKASVLMVSVFVILASMKKEVIAWKHLVIK